MPAFRDNGLLRVALLKMQLAFSVLDAVALELGGARLVLPENLHERAWAQSERRRCGFRIAVLLRHDVEHVGDKQRKLRIARLDMPVTARESHFDIGGRFADIQRQCHLHAVQCVNFVFFRAPAFGRLYF